MVVHLGLLSAEAKERARDCAENGNRCSGLGVTWSTVKVPMKPKGFVTLNGEKYYRFVRGDGKPEQSLMVEFNAAAGGIMAKSDAQITHPDVLGRAAVKLPHCQASFESSL